MTQSNRIAGGVIDRTTSLTFSFDGKRYQGHPGDTLASALLANGVRLIGRSFKYHRPRGPLTSGSEEPNALVELRGGARREPNTRATVAELYDGLEARSQNRWPSLAIDAMAVNDLFAEFLGAGFYYKTFMWPKSFWEKVYEPIIRRAAGLGRASLAADPDRYGRGYLHCDLLIVGAGPAGLAAALTAARTKARVILIDEDCQIGGRLSSETATLGDAPAMDWVRTTIAELMASPNVRVMPRTTLVGVYDHGVTMAIERVADHLALPPDGAPRQVMWRITARHTLLCCGATERAIAFPDNDRPGIMTAGALRAYANRWGALVDRRVAVFCCHDDGHRTARDLIRAGAEVCLIDSRADAPKVAGLQQFNGAVVTGTAGRRGLTGVMVRLASGETRTVACGALGVSGGWNPNLQLACHKRNRPVWSDAIAAFVAGDTAGLTLAGAANGSFSTAAALQEGALKATQALEALGYSAASQPALPQAEDAPTRIAALWHVPGKGRAWLDLQNDVTVKDIRIAHQENFRSVEHLKRYTTLGMATDQGKTANVGAIAIMSELTGQSIAATGTTIYRPPYVPVALGALAGPWRGDDFRPRRLTPSHEWAEQQGAVFVEVGTWMRAQYFPRPGESGWRQTVDREAKAVRSAVGVCDVTTLGKIEVHGQDAAVFLDRIYCNTMSTLPVGRTRYGLMLREDGFVFDDGTAARFAQDHFVVTTTTAHAAEVMRHMEFCRQGLWPDLDVQIVSATEAWAQFAVAGPRSRDLLERVVDPGVDLSNGAFPFMACAEVSVGGGLPARLFRISFSGELAYEIAVPARFGDALVRRLMEAGEPFGVTPYGTEALGVLRIEKGHAAGGELTGQTTAANLGLGRMVSSRKDAIGIVLSHREGLTTGNDLRLVGLVPIDPAEPITGGAHLLDREGEATLATDQGWVTSTCFSPHLGHAIGLAMLRRGDQRHGEIMRQDNRLEGRSVEVRVVSPHFIDAEGERLRG